MLCSTFLGISSIAFSDAYRGTHLNAANAGEFGDFVGGYFGPIFSLVSIFFVIVTLREQRETTAAEKIAGEVDAFEERFYRLIDMHRANVSEMLLDSQFTHIRPVRGRKVFITILAELQTAVECVRAHDKQFQLGLSALEQLQASYYFVFYGIGDNSSATLYRALGASKINLPAANLVEIQERLERKQNENTTVRHFDGHQVRLGHYYRHLFQAVDFVHRQPLIQDKRSYVKTLRAQLSTQEQVLLLVNALTPLGWRWFNEEYIQYYGLIKNIPAGMLERYCGVSARNLFNEGYWEDERISVRPVLLDKVERTVIR